MISTTDSSETADAVADPIAAGVEPKASTGLHPNAKKFIKFGIVGASSTVINFGLYNLLQFKLGMSLVPATTIAFVCSALNAFTWNRHWTWKEARGKPMHTQGARYLTVSAVGWLLNTSIVVLIIAHFHGNGHGFLGDQFKKILIVAVTGQGKQNFGFWLSNLALLVATGVVVFWNFFANHFWTFEHRAD